MEVVLCGFLVASQYVAQGLMCGITDHVRVQVQALILF